MPLGAWDSNGFGATWWDVDGNAAGWWDKDAIPFVAVAPPPPPPPPPPRPQPIISVNGGGGGGGVTYGARYVPPPWLPQYIIPFEECDELCPDESVEVADFALMHVTPPEGAVVKALADGTVETMIDAKGRRSVVLTGDDGTRYWYADVGATSVTNGARVRTGQAIARTKPDAQSIPEITPAARRPELDAGDGAPPPPPKKPKPAQVVFVEPPPEIAIRVLEYPLRPPPLPPKQWVMLIPIEPPPLPPPPRKLHVLSPILRAVAPVALVAALLYALSAFEPKPLPKPRSRRKRRR
jgi:Peptidase family M23